MSYLAGYVDPGLDVNADEDSKDLTQIERTRLTKQLATVLGAALLPRRLGGEATKEELSNDKRRCKRVAHVLNQCLQAWGGPIREKQDVGQESAQLNWDAWVADQKIYLADRTRYIATWCSKTGGDERWAKSAVVRLTNEQRWLEYALR